MIKAAVHHVVQRGLGAPAAEEDFVQEVFLHLCRDGFRALRRFDASRAALPTYLIVIARTVVLGILRHRRPALDSLEDAPEPAVAPAPLPISVENIPRGLLSPRQQLILHLIYDRGLDPEEISGMLTISRQTVRSLHHKAVLKLRRLLLARGSQGEL